MHAMLIDGKPAPKPANDETPQCLVFASPSPGPYEADVEGPTESGAILLMDADGEIIGWATDAAGHTSEVVMPEGRSPQQIATNARLLREAREMLGICGLLDALEPILTARLMTIGAASDEYLTMAATKARAVLARVYAGAPT